MIDKLQLGYRECVKSWCNIEYINIIKTYMKNSKTFVIWLMM